MFLPRTFRPLIRHFNTKPTPTFENAIAELNKEMEQVFGEPPCDTDFSPTTNNISTSEEPHFAPAENVKGLTHVNTTTGKAQMVDVSSKDTTKRVAIAVCKVILGKTVFDLVSANQIAKGNALSVAKIAGITGAKQTSNLIPLCHNINLTHVNLDLTLNERNYSVEIQGKVSTTGMTGVEMEALTAVTVAGLTVYDMCKAASKDIQITDVRLEHKSGGKSGAWSRKT
ncbi:cyclic pyranopterin monophosphate synthase [Ranunculus cassubicifolius]